MKNTGKVTLLITLIIMTLACNALIPKPKTTAIPTAKSLPTSMLEPTNPPAPTEEPTQIIEVEATATEADSGPALPPPAGTPAKEWNDIPIMPGAIAGEGDDHTYSFTIKSSVYEIQKFYEKEMAKLGWNPFATGEGQTEVVMLIFMKDTDTLTLTFLPQNDGTIYVMLVK